MYFQSDTEVKNRTVYVEIRYKDIGITDLLLQYNSVDDNYKPAQPVSGTDLQNTGSLKTAIFELKNADFRNAQNLGADLRIVTVPHEQMYILSANLFFELPPGLVTSDPSFTLDSNIVSTTVFHWYAPNGGQLSGPWRPVEGRENWTGEPRWWKSQIMQIMAANIDVLWVHLIPQTENIRINLFKALYELRREGYDVPKVAPFLDPLITWFEQPKVDVGTSDGKDEVANQYIRFFEQFYSATPDMFADDYIAKIDGRIILDTWHVHINMDNLDLFTREDLKGRLQSAFATDHPIFNNGIYMISTAFSPQVFSFADERVPQFEVNEYYVENIYNDLKTVQLKAGYWDQNVRTPGDFLPRDGGVPYREAWQQLDETVDRIYIESWNEYDEGTGIYAGDTGEPFIKPGSDNPNTDIWSTSDDPYEYIKTTDVGAAKFNDAPQLNAKILAHTLPDTIPAGETLTATVTVRNTGDASWSNQDGYTFGQLDDGPFISEPASIDDSEDEIPLYGGIFRGRPKTFPLRITAPSNPGNYTVRWSMIQGENGPFGEELEVTIQVTGFGVGNEDINDIERPVNFTLFQNFPNPFNASTNIKFSVPMASLVEIAIYNILGNRVATVTDGTYAPGDYTVTWNADNVATGIYFVRMRAGEINHNQFAGTIKVVLLK